MQTKVRDQRPGGFAGARAGNRHHVFFRGNSDGPQHPPLHQLRAPQIDIAVLETVR